LQHCLIYLRVSACLRVSRRPPRANYDAEFRTRIVHDCRKSRSGYVAEDWARPVVGWELQARDAKALRSFYAQMFNWEMGDDTTQRIAAGIGGPLPGPVGTIRQSDRPGLSLAIQVLDLGASLAKAASLGGKVLRQGKVVPGEVTTATILDPEGNRILLIQQ
jgi:uncharacterized protein